MEPNTINRTGRPVVVTTAHNGVFFGYADDTTGDTIRLRAGRVCLYWAREVRGFVGLAATGPNSKSRVSPAAPEMEIRAITSVLECTPEAVAAWESEPWGD